MTERDFELIYILNKTKNITRAADILYVTQSALSKRIHIIEEELGVTLLTRSRQGIHFTPEGEQVLRYTKKATYELEQMRKAINMSRSYICGTLNAGVSINYSLYCLPELLVSYRKQYPHVSTHITTDQSRKLYLQVLDGKIDLAILRGEYPWKENKILLSRENICAICSDSDRERSLSDMPYIGRETDSFFQRELAQWFHENNLRTTKNGIFVDSITTCVEMVSRGLGWAIVPEICLKNFKGNIRPLRFKNGELFVRSTYLIYSDTALKLPQVEAFINIIKNHMK